MTRKEMIGKVKKIFYGPTDNKVISEVLDQLDAVLPHVFISDLIFHGPDDLTPEQIVDEAISRENENNSDSSQF